MSNHFRIDLSKGQHNKIAKFVSYYENCMVDGYRYKDAPPSIYAKHKELDAGFRISTEEERDKIDWIFVLWWELVNFIQVAGTNYEIGVPSKQSSLP